MISLKAKLKADFVFILVTLSTACFLFGFAQAVCSWFLEANFTNVKFYYGTVTEIKRHSRETHLLRSSYWWGGLFYIIPSLLAALTYHRRTVFLATMCFISNLICLVLSSVASVLVFNLHSITIGAGKFLDHQKCKSSYNVIHKVYECFCNEYRIFNDVFKKAGFLALNIKCEQISKMEKLLAATWTLGGVASLIAFSSLCLSTVYAIRNRNGCKQPILVLEPVISYSMDSDTSEMPNNPYESSSIHGSALTGDDRAALLSTN